MATHSPSQKLKVKPHSPHQRAIPSPTPGVASEAQPLRNATPSPTPGPAPTATDTTKAPRLPPSTIKLKRRRDEEPVAYLHLEAPDKKRIKDSEGQARPKYIFRLKASSDNSQPFQPPVLKGSTTPSPPSPVDPPHGTKRKSNDVPKRFTLSKRMRSHPYAAVFERMADRKTPEPSAASSTTTSSASRVPPITQPAVERKKPRIHPKEREALRQSRQERYTAEDEARARDAELMMLEYLSLDSHNALGGLPPMPKLQVDIIGGGVGGGSWSHPAAAADEEDDGDWVYDVYTREEHPGDVNAETDKNYGVIVFEGADDEEWWYEGANAEEDSDAGGGDDEDSNAEDFHTNDYPDEISGGEEDDEEDLDDEDGMMWKRNRVHRIRGEIDSDNEEEYDLDLDSSEDDEPTASRLERDVWGLR